MIGAHARSATMRTLFQVILIMACVDLQAQQRPVHALSISIGRSFYSQATVTSASGTSHAQFGLNGWGGSVGYRRWLSRDWYASGTIRADISTIGFSWSGSMEPMGHWAGPNDRSIGLPPHEFLFSAARVDLGRTILERGRWSARGEFGLEFLVMPSLAMYYVHAATVNGAQVPEALSYRIITAPEARMSNRLRAALSGVYTGKRSNEWVFGLAGVLGLQPDMLTGRYAVVTPTGPEAGEFAARLSGIELSIARYFTWGAPKLPRWAVQDAGH